MDNHICAKCQKPCKQIEKSILLHCKNFLSKPIQLEIKFKKDKKVKQLGS